MNPIDVLKTPVRFEAPEHAADEIISQIIKIGRLSKLQDNWDSYGGQATPFELCKKAAKYLYASFKELYKASSRRRPLLYKR
ncbi:MAG: hypothetical protein AAB354_06885 [candidate division KSB1 bacterium]